MARPLRPEREFLVADTDGSRATWFFVEDRDFAYPDPRFTVRAMPGPEAAHPVVVVTVTAGSLLRDLTILADRLDPRAEVDDMLTTLLPGESATYRVTALSRADADRFRPPVLWTAADVASS